MSMRALLNIEGAFAICWLFLVWFRSSDNSCGADLNDRRWMWFLVLVPLPFIPFLSFPFLADDYTHILYARHLTVAGLRGLFTTSGADRFFRPAGYLAYALDAQWAGMSPVLWRLSSLLLHVGNAVLVAVLCRSIGLRTAPLLFGALLFGLHGSRPEAVTWVAARFDLLAVFFGIGCLLLVLRNRPVWASLALFIAVLSKESAFMVPLLAVAVLWFKRVKWAELARRVMPLFSIAAAVFVYRWQLIGGIGGYQSATNGAPQIFRFTSPSTLKALFPRLWGTLLFPLNWTTPLGAVRLCLMVLSVAGLISLALGKPERRTFLLGVIFTYISALPVHQFLSIGADLEKSRVLYFPSAGFAIVFASLVTSRRLLIPAALVVLFQVVALEHNLFIWKRVAFQAREACRAGAHDLPNVVDGVYFLHTGYPECLEFR